MMKNQPTPVKNSIWQVLDSLNIKNELCARMIQKEWESILGASLAQHCQFMSYHKQILTVRIDQAQWMTEFQRYQREIIQRFNNQLGAKLISKIQLEQPQSNTMKKAVKFNKKTKKNK